MDSVRMRLVNLDINSPSISLVQSQSTLISNVSSGNWSAYQDIMVCIYVIFWHPRLRISNYQVLASPDHRDNLPFSYYRAALNRTYLKIRIRAKLWIPTSPILSLLKAELLHLKTQAILRSSPIPLSNFKTFASFVLFLLLQVRSWICPLWSRVDAPAVDIFMNGLLVYSNLMPQNSSFYIPVIKGLFNVSVVPSASSGSTNQTMGEGSLNQTLGNETTPTNQSTSGNFIRRILWYRSSSIIRSCFIPNFLFLHLCDHR